MGFSGHDDDCHTCDQCVICLQDLRDNNIGTFVSCGHCIHCTCYQEYWMSYRKRIEEVAYRATGLSQPAGNHNTIPRCPICQSQATSFQRIYVSLSAAGRLNRDDKNNNIRDSQRVLSQPAEMSTQSLILESTDRGRDRVDVASSNVQSGLILNMSDEQAVASRRISTTETTNHLVNSHSPSPTLSSLDYLYRIAISQLNTMLIQREINIIQGKFVAELHAMVIRNAQLQQQQQQQDGPSSPSVLESRSDQQQNDTDEGEQSQGI